MIGQSRVEWKDQTECWEKEDQVNEIPFSHQRRQINQNFADKPQPYGNTQITINRLI